jgi:hypothetical protein
MRHWVARVHRLSSTDVLCGNPRCPQVLTRAVVADPRVGTPTAWSLDGTWLLQVDLGYAENAPGHWQFTNYAARAFKRGPHTPRTRRPLIPAVPYGNGRMKRDADGRRVLVGIRSGYYRLALTPGWSGRRHASISGQLLTFYGEITFTCPRCGTETVIREADLDAAASRHVVRPSGLFHPVQAFAEGGALATR